MVVARDTVARDTEARDTKTMDQIYTIKGIITLDYVFYFGRTSTGASTVLTSTTCPMSPNSVRCIGDFINTFR